MIGDVGRGMARNMHHLNLKRAYVEALTIVKHPVEIGAVGLHLLKGEDRSKDFLHLTDMFTDTDYCTCVCFYVRGGGEMIRVRMGLQDHGDAPSPLSRAGQNICG